MEGRTRGLRQGSPETSRACRRSGSTPSGPGSRLKSPSKPPSSRRTVGTAAGGRHGRYDADRVYDVLLIESDGETTVREQFCLDSRSPLRDWCEEPPCWTAFDSPHAVVSDSRERASGQPVSMAVLRSGSTNLGRRREWQTHDGPGRSTVGTVPTDGHRGPTPPPERRVCVFALDCLRFTSGAPSQSIEAPLCGDQPSNRDGKSVERFEPEVQMPACSGRASSPGTRLSCVVVQSRSRW